MQITRVGLLVAVGLAVGCQSTPKSDRPTLFFPSPPSEPRIQFLTYANGAEDVEPQRGSFETFVLGEQPAVQRMINKPYGAVVKDGVAYICDTKGLCICRLDFKERKYSIFGYSGPGRLKKPINITMDPLGYKFVADTEREQIIVYGPTDDYVTAFDVPKPCRPVDVAVHGDELYVLDNDESCQIVVLNRQNGEVLRTFGEPGGEPGQFKIPNSICVDAAGDVYVSDTHNWRIQKLTSEGESIWVKGTPGYRLGQFGRPRGIRVGPDNILYVVDGATEIVQMFDTEGQTLMRFGGPGDVPGALGLPSSVAIDRTSIPYFQQYVHADFEVDYLLFVISQYGQHLVSVYAFGSFPEGYQLGEAAISSLPSVSEDEGIGPVGPDVAPPMDR